MLSSVDMGAGSDVVVIKTRETVDAGVGVMALDDGGFMIGISRGPQSIAIHLNADELREFARQLAEIAA